MKMICAWCDKLLKEGKGEASHEICDECRIKLLKEGKENEGTGNQ